MEEDQLIELWKPIEGYENKYEVSSLGKIKSLARLDSIGRKIKERVMSTKPSQDGYSRVYLESSSTRKVFLVHRLVALAFIPCANISLVVNHKDGIKSNNSIENLEWVSQKDNVIHAKV